MRDAIEKVLDRIRPALNFHDGDIELVKIDKKNRTIYVHFVGTCDHCAISEITLRHLVEKEIRSSVPAIRNVVAVAA